MPGSINVPMMRVDQGSPYRRQFLPRGGSRGGGLSPSQQLAAYRLMLEQQGGPGSDKYQKAWKRSMDSFQAEMQQHKYNLDKFDENFKAAGSLAEKESIRLKQLEYAKTLPPLMKKGLESRAKGL